MVVGANNTSLGVLICHVNNRDLNFNSVLVLERLGPKCSYYE